MDAAYIDFGGSYYLGEFNTQPVEQSQPVCEERDTWGRLYAPVTIPEEIVSVVLVEVIPKSPSVQHVRFADARRGKIPISRWLCVDLFLLLLGNR